MNAAEALALNEALESKYVRFDGSGDLVGTIWQDRPPMSAEPVWRWRIVMPGERGGKDPKAAGENVSGQGYGPHFDVPGRYRLAAQYPRK